MQTTANREPAAFRAGMIADSRSMRHVASKIGSGNIKAGIGAFNAPGLSAPGDSPKADPGLIYQNPSPAAAVDVDAIVTTRATAASLVTLTAADFNGVHGAAECFPPRILTITANSNANWDATSIEVTYIGADNLTHTETLAMPDGGNTTLSTTGRVKIPVSIKIPAQSGTGGSYTIGYAVLDASLTVNDFLGVPVYDAWTMEGRAENSALGEYGHGDTVPVLVKGAIAVETEGTCADRGDVYVRVSPNGGNTQIGKFRADADSATAVLVPNARFERATTDGAVNVVAFY